MYAATELRVPDRITGIRPLCPSYYQNGPDISARAAHISYHSRPLFYMARPISPPPLISPSSPLPHFASPDRSSQRYSPERFKLFFSSPATEFDGIPAPYLIAHLLSSQLLLPMAGGNEVNLSESKVSALSFFLYLIRRLFDS